jgi:ESCRT-II complex subunit VPS22
VAQRRTNSLTPYNIASKGFWAEVLGFGDFYYELAVQIVEVCYSTREETGGLLDMSVLLKRLQLMRQASAQEISEADVERAIKTLEPLGSGYRIINLSHRRLIQSVPREFSTDQTLLLNKAEALRGRFGRGDLAEWSQERFHGALSSLIDEGLVWIDEQEPSCRPQYWMASFFDL